LPGLNGYILMLVLCRLQQRKPPLTYIQLAAFEETNKTKTKRQLVAKRYKRKKEQSMPLQATLSKAANYSHCEDANRNRGPKATARDQGQLARPRQCKKVVSGEGK